MTETKRDFNKEAAMWDENPGRVKLVKEIAYAMTEEIKFTPDMNVLDFGCGTGLLTLQLQPLVSSITGLDSSQGMLDGLLTKIKDKNLINVKTLYMDIENDGILKGNYNLIVSSMTIHHIRDISHVLNQFYNILLPSGQICIADLDSDDGQFHEDNQGVFHFGFDRYKLGGLFSEAGFKNIKCRTAAKITKPVGGKEFREFTIFLMTGCKA
jgi:ubiquinone/menaquinone biosynthesis C-methylase UbiE